MKNLIYLFCLAFLISCGNTQKPEETPETPEIVEPKPEPKPIAKPEEPRVAVIFQEQMIGNFVGGFMAKEFDENKEPSWSNRINIKVEKIEGNIIEGKSIVAGNFRP
ncbi:MAG: hypothetical protein ACPG5P_01800, partial [Saprospiraceae bacterium]